MLRVTLVPAGAILLLASLMAQTPTGTLQGTVSDQTGAGIPEASIVIKNTQTNITATLKTDSAGRYVQPFLSPGIYEVEAVATGFQSVRQGNIKLDVSQNRSIDFSLSIGSTKTEISVEGTAAALDFNTSALGQVIENKKVLDLPLNGRNPFDLAALSPGVSTIGGASTPHIGGSRNGNNEQQIDGMTNITPENNVGNNGTAYTPIVDSVQEFSVSTNSLSAEYGRFAGGMMNLVTKSGTNQIHGSGFTFARNAVMDANDYFANMNGASKPDMHRYQYGGTVGGPIVIPGLYDGHNKSFFFFGYQGNRESDLATETNTVPIDAFRQGNYTALGAVVYDPLTATKQTNGNWVRSAFSGNVVPTNRFDAVGAKLMSYYPEPNTGAPGAQTNNLFTAGSSINNYDQWDAKVDHNFSEKWKMFVRFSHSWSTNKPLSDYGNVASQGWGGPTTGGAWSGSMDHTVTINPTFLLDLRYGVSRATAVRDTYSNGFDLTSLGFPRVGRVGRRVTRAGVPPRGHVKRGFRTWSEWLGGSDRESAGA